VNQTTGGTITTNPSGNASANTDVTVTVSPNQGYTFNSSSLSVVADNYPVEYQVVSSSNNSYTFTMPASDVMISGTFTGGSGQTGYAITVNQTEGGTITTNPSGSAAANTTVTVTGAPDDNYYLADIRVMAGNTLVDSQASSTGDGYTFTMPASDVTVTGTFAESGWVVQMYLITTYTSIGGTITTDPGSAAEGATVTVNATPDEGYAMASFLSVTSGNQTIDAQAKDTAGTIWTFTMPASNVDISGAFATDRGEPEYRITPYVNGDGSVTTNPQEKATAGTTVWFYVTPYQGSTMESLSVIKANGDAIDYQAGTNSALGGSGYTFTMPSMNVAINAEFTGGTTPSEYKIYVNETNGGTISTNPSGNAPAKTTVTVTVSPNQGYTFDSSSLSVVADNYPVDYQTSQSSTGVVYTFTMPDSDVMITGTFLTSGSGGPGQTGYAITVNQTTGGTVTTNPSGSATAGTFVKVTGTPTDNHYLSGIRVMAGNTLVDSQESAAGDGYIFTMPAAAVTVTGTFAQKQ
jgi:hypothetical protein